MTTTHPSRIFPNGTATTLYVTIPAQIVTDSRFPFEADDPVTVTVKDESLVITPDTETKPE